MAVSYQDINELLARGNASSSDEIKKADQYLKSGLGEEPAWLNDFFESNKSKLNETILRAISSVEGISSLSGYNEGYFNEIIQNANDLHAGDSIEVNVSTDGMVYSVECVYKDKGFSVSNIYGFLNREMSDKSSEEGQTGKFGVGIKSFFKFVTRLRIESNIILDFSIDRDNSKVISDVCVNEQWDNENTVLSFEYKEDESTENEFNTEKLSALIEYLDNDSNDDISRFFISGEDNELLFDIHSLIFMNRYTNKTTICRMNFSGNYHRLYVEYKDICEIQEIEYRTKKWKIRNVCLNVFLDDNEYSSIEYIVFTNGTTSLGFPLNTELEGNNRIYSTYYIKSDDKPNMMPVGMIIDTASANIHRNDLGDNEKSISDAYQKIVKIFTELMWFMCSEEITSVQCLNEVSDIFHSLLYRYIGKDCEYYKESPFNLEGLDNQYLPKKYSNSKTDIVVHKTEENYQKASYYDKDSVAALTETYFQVIEKDNVIDYNELVDSGECIDGVAKIYGYLSENCGGDEKDYETALRMLHFFPGVAEYITCVVSGEYRDEPFLSDLEIDQWLYELKNTMGEKYNQDLYLKLIGRYELNPALAFDGKVKNENLSFKDYLFNGLPELEEGVFSNWQNNQYDSQYAEMKRQISGNRLVDPGNSHNIYKIRYIEPKGMSRRRWDGWYDYYGHNINKCDVSDANKLILLEKLASDSKMIKSFRKRSMQLYEKQVVSLRRRDKFFEYSYPEREQQILCFDFLKNINLSDFGEFLHAVEYRKIIRERIDVFNIRIRCVQPSITTYDITNKFLPYLVGINDENSKTAYLMSEYNAQDVSVMNIEDNTNNELPEENKNFIYRLTGYNIHLSHFYSGSKKYMTAYFGNSKAAIKTAANASFKQMATFNSVNKDVYIFYDNVPDVQAVVSAVLSDLKIPKDLMDLLMGYIHNGNDTKTMNYFSRRRTFARVRKNLVLDWADIEPYDINGAEDIEVMYRLLTARGSYDIYCPICSDIPLETFDYGEDTKKKHSRKIIVMENENHETKQEYPYIITVGCSYCFEKLRNTLSKSEFDGKSITLTTQISQGQHERMRSRHQIKLSPVNIQIMKNFKFSSK